MTHYHNRLVVLIPAHNEEASVAAVVVKIKQILACDVVVIDDASTDKTAEKASAAGAIVLPLILQLGAWGATQCGIRYALRNGYQIAITMDADNQHDALYIHRLVEPLLNGNTEVVIGAYPDRISRIRHIACEYFRVLTGLRLEDITSGFRAYNRNAMAVLATPAASLLDYQDVGVLLMLRKRGMRVLEVQTPMQLRVNGHSRVFSSWFAVAKYMLQTTLLCITRIKS